MNSINNENEIFSENNLNNFNNENFNNNFNNFNNENYNFVFEICQLFDKDSNETIDSNDLIDLIKALGIMLNEENISLIQEFQKNNFKKEKISFDEFFELFEKLNSNKKSFEEEEEELTKAFQFFDSENSGFIDEKYFKKAICTFGNKLTEEEFDELMKKAIFDKTNKNFNYKEFIKIILEKNY
jgi:Ca2+-binding EF-hand superfamily protein